MTLVFALSSAVAIGASADDLAVTNARDAALSLFVDDTGGDGTVSTQRATGFADFVRFNGSAPALSGTGPWSEARAESLLARYGGLFGVIDPARELELTDISISWRGGARFDYQQVFEGVPVFGGLLRLHFDEHGQAIAMNGLFVPNVAVDDVRPLLTSAEAESFAISAVEERLSVLADSALPERPLVAAPGTQLQVFRDGLLRGFPDGITTLAYQVEVTNYINVREYLHVDAWTGKVVHRIEGIHDALLRRVYDGREGGYLPGRPTQNSLREEGEPATGDTDVDEIFDVSGDAHNLFMSGFGFDSYNGSGAGMLSVAYLEDRYISCPNAMWNGVTTAFCEGVTSDDVVAHEWVHAYTEYTHNLIYAWQPGALNEAYSDIFGYTVALLNEGCDLPDLSCAPMGRRTDGFCSSEGISPPPVVIVSEPESIVGDYRAAGAAFGPQLSDVGAVTGTVVAAQPADGCRALTNSDEIAGNIALIDRGTCLFVDKVESAQEAGATAIIVINIESNEIFEMGSSPGARAEIPAVMVGRTDGETLRSALADSVVATLQVSLGGADDSSRWLIGSVETGVGVLRDMWRPNCFGHPGRVGDSSYYCGPYDGGGVHLNSGVPNHAYALLVDGGTFNGYVIEGIGITKAAHIYWIAMSEYQIPATDFEQHADSLEAACADLLDSGVDLADLVTGAPSGEIVTSADCDSLANVIDATELRDAPPCNFQTVLDGNPPRLCPGGSTTIDFEDNFESDPTETWTFANQGDKPEYVETDWAWVHELPSGRSGSAFFARSSYYVGDCGADDQSGVVRMTSPTITLPTEVDDDILFVFDHYVATEPTWDGGNLAISINGADFQLIDSDAFLFNPYNARLSDAPDNTNPMEGQDAFTGVDEGTVQGTWGQSQILLSEIAEPGDEVQIQFNFGVDGCNGIDGWYVDDVAVVHCGPCVSNADCDDGNSCTQDVCDVELGACSNDAEPAGTTCGDPDDNECSAPDTCDGFGFCDSNDAAIGTACGDAAESECDAADSCDGEGRCQTNHARTGSPCGDDSATECNRADICDSAGRCNDNLAPTNTPCGDRTETDCTAPDTCDEAGACLANDAEDGLECSSGSMCMSGGSCDGGFCANEEPVDCSDGDRCTTDQCDEENGCSNHPIDDAMCTDDGPDMGQDTDFDGFPGLDADGSELPDGAGPNTFQGGGGCNGCRQVMSGSSTPGRIGLLGLLVGVLVVRRRRVRE